MAAQNSGHCSVDPPMIATTTWPSAVSNAWNGVELGWRVPMRPGTSPRLK